MKTHEGKSTLARPRSFNTPRMFALSFLVLVAPVLAHAGPPLICHPFDIGTAKSLPGGSERFGTSESYDRAKLVEHTLSLLDTNMPVIVRMETLRRATIYATRALAGSRRGESYTADDQQLALGLLKKLKERTVSASGTAQAIALFDLGYYMESLRQAAFDKTLDGYDLLVKAAELRPDDAEIQFALALASSSPKRAEHEQFLARARSGAKDGSLLAANLRAFFQRS